MTTESLTAPPCRVLTGRKVLMIFAAFFGTVASADAFLILSAVRTWSGTEATSPYRAGQLYNGELALARAQAARGWSLRPVVAREPDGAARIVVDLRDHEGRPVAGRVLAAMLERPTDKRADRPVALVERAPGSHVGVVAGIAPGQWDLVVDVLEGEARAFRRRTRLVLP